MKRKLVGAAGILSLLICLMGAGDSFSYNVGQPNPNPNGAASKIEANGTYALGAGHALNGVSFITDDGIVSSSVTATAAAGAWTVAPMGLPKGTYTCTAALSVDDGQKIWASSQLAVGNVIVK